MTRKIYAFGFMYNTSIGQIYGHNVITTDSDDTLNAALELLPMFCDSVAKERSIDEKDIVITFVTLLKEVTLTSYYH